MKDWPLGVVPPAVARAVGQIPPFNDPRVRLGVLRALSNLRRTRRRSFEHFGSARYSRPAAFEMDRRLEQYLPTGPGFFVEAGANDGYLQSNTYYLERFKGWSGVLVEPIPELFERCVVERPRSMVFNCALVREGYPDPTVRMHYGGLTSVVSGARGSTKAEEEHVRVGNPFGWDRNYFVDVPARTLSSVLDEADATTIDLLSLDVEGYEEEALLGLRLESHAPRLVLIEALETERRASIRNALGTSYELVTEFSPSDLLFRLRGSV